MLNYDDSNNNDFYEGFYDFMARLRNAGDDEIDAGKRNRIIEKLTSILTYEPKIGILGKTSVGKSSLCNALFGEDICEISDIEACTRSPQEVLLNMGNNAKGLKLIDVPGVGESSARDIDYAELYKKLLPELDLVLWVLKADGRAYAADESFYNSIIKPYIDAGKPFLFVLNQCDKIEPFREWDEYSHEPGTTQKDNIARKVDSISRYFSISKNKIIPVSANERYNLAVLVENIVLALPNDKCIAFLQYTKKENWSDTSVSIVKKAWYEIMIDGIISVVNKIGDVITAIFQSF